jgi:phosphatidylglycerol:prolipoprotein diacylglycerol transferase
MSFPVYLHLGSFRLHPHLVFETLAYAVAFRVYLWLRKRKRDAIGDANRWWLIAAAAMGAAAGSKILYWFEDPQLTIQNHRDPAYLLGGKTIVGALIGGLAAVEWMKKRLKITSRTGDLFAVPLCIGIAIGRIGCFLTGTEDHTAGVITMLPWGVNFGDGVLRHPTQLYEIAFVLALSIFLWRKMQRPHLEGDIFKKFMAFYFVFRFSCDFLKPDVRVLAGLSSIQWTSAGILVYYAGDIARWFLEAMPHSGESAFEKSARLGEE